MDGKRAMNTTFRSCLALSGVAVIWLQALVSAGFGQTIGSQDRLRVGMYPVLAMPKDSASAHLAGQISSLLFIALSEENLIPLPPDSFDDFLQSRPAFDPFHPDSVRKLCAAYLVQKMLLPAVSVDAASSPFPRVRVILRWLDGASGEVTKFHASEHRLPQTGATAFALAPDFDGHALIHALLSAPELILSQDEAVAPLPVPVVLPEPVMTSNKSHKWWWYLSAAAVLGGGTAYWFLGRGAEEDQPRLLPEPPGPPQ